MAQLYQWTVPCTICESPVEYHCNTCGDVFCGKCRDIHLKSKATRHHVIVPFSQRVEPNQSLECGDHPGHQCGVWCQTCNRAVCSECVISPTHRGHVFLKFDEKIGEKRREIQKQLEQCSTLLSEWQKSLEKAKQVEDSYLKDVKQLDKEIVDRADELCKQVRVVEQENRKQLQKMKDASVRVLYDQQKTLTDGIHRLKKTIKETEETLRYSDTSTILQYSVDVKITDTNPPVDDPPLALVFMPGSLDVQVLKNLFGLVSDKKGQAGGSKAAIQNKHSIPLLKEPSVESTIDVNCPDPLIAWVGSGQAWVKTKNRRLQLVDRHGVAQRTVNINFDMYDLAVTSQGEVLLTDRKNKCIRSISITGDFQTVFSTQWEPYGVCCLPSGDVVVAFTFDRRVVQYSSSGKVIREMDRSLFQCPWYMAYNKVNKQLYVCDKTTDYTPNNPGRVLALCLTGTLQYIYIGSDNANFTPYAVSTDPAGHVLITDYDNHRVHILDKGGNFMQYLLTEEQGLTCPLTIDVDGDGYAWVAEYYTRKVKVVKYVK